MIKFLLCPFLFLAACQNDDGEKEALEKERKDLAKEVVELQAQYAKLWRENEETDILDPSSGLADLQAQLAVLVKEREELEAEHRRSVAQFEEMTESFKKYREKYPLDESGNRSE